MVRTCKIILQLLKHNTDYAVQEKGKKIHLSHCSGETISALNRTSALSRDFAAIDSVRFSKSPCPKKVALYYQKDKGAWVYVDCPTFSTVQTFRSTLWCMKLNMVSEAKRFWVQVSAFAVKTKKMLALFLSTFRPFWATRERGWSMWIARPSPPVCILDSTGWCMKLNKRYQVFRMKIQTKKHVRVFGLVDM